jgi:hypothetical protein
MCKYYIKVGNKTTATQKEIQMARNAFDTCERYFDDSENLGFCPQGSIQGIRALGFRWKYPNYAADELGLNKDGRSCRGVRPGFRPVDNSKKRGIKAVPKSQKRFSIRFVEVEVEG